MTQIALNLSADDFEDGVWLTTVINTNSPRMLDNPMAQGLIDFAHAGQMSVVTPFGLAGAMAPITPAGALTLQHAEAMFGIPSALDPPSGCAFQTRCRWKSQVPGGLCEREMPAVRTLPDNHKIKCHLTDEQLATMEPVIKIAAAE